MNTSLLIIAHGSRLATSNSEVSNLKEKIVALNQHPKESNESNQTSFKFSFIEAAFLELATPSISEGINRCIQQGADKIIVFPYFLAKGRHVKEDIPSILAEAKKNLPRPVKIEMIDYFGQLPGIEELIFNFVVPK